MKKESINIRDPYVVYENGKYYLIGTRGKNFGCRTAGFDVYVSDDLDEWEDPIECFNSEKFGMNRGVNWAPEIHKYNDKYYIFATFTKENGLKGTYSLSSDTITGPFLPHSNGALTPNEWECLDGTLYVDSNGIPYLIFCHEYTQIKDGTICYTRLNPELTAPEGETITLFSASQCKYVDMHKSGGYVTDGPFMHRSASGELFMIWSSFIKGNYAELVVRFKDGKFGLEFEHLPPLIDSDGGHGMIFSDNSGAYFTYHTPNKKEYEHPAFCKIKETEGQIIINI